MVKFLRSLECQKRIHLVVLDGYKDEDRSHSFFPTACHSWVLEQMEHRQHISVKSMRSCKQLHPSLKAEMKLRQEYVASWRNDHYREAVQNSALFKQVVKKLDAHIEVPGSIVDHRDMIESKFCFAGWSLHSDYGSSLRRYFVQSESM